MDINEVLKYVILPFVLALEQGDFKTFFVQSQREEHFCGTIFSVLGINLSYFKRVLTHHFHLGDHMGQIVLEGLKGPKCKFPSRYYLTPKETMDEVSDKKIKRPEGMTFNSFFTNSNII
jgi:hypothetical protein